MHHGRLLLFHLTIAAAGLAAGCKGSIDPGGCFIGGTPILTPAGPVPIEAMRPGQLVYAWDEARGALALGSVQQVFVHRDAPYGLLPLPGGAQLGVTAEHPVYAAGRWVPAGTLAAGDAVLTLALDSAGPALARPKLGGGSRPSGRATVYNLSVSPHANYFAGGLLVHNKSPPCSEYLFPDCPDGSLLIIDSQDAPQCGSVPSRSIVIPGPCPDEQALTADGTSFRCVAKDRAVAVADLTTVLTRVEDALLQAERKLAAGRLPRPAYIGVTTATSAGKMSVPPHAIGLESATASCDLEYPASTLCAPLDFVEAAALRRFGAGTVTPRAWVFFPAWNRRAGGSFPEAGLGDSCASYSESAAASGWAGASATWGALPGSAAGLSLPGGASAPCDGLLPLACCR